MEVDPKEEEVTEDEDMEDVEEEFTLMDPQKQLDEIFIRGLLMALKS